MGKRKEEMADALYEVETSGSDIVDSPPAPATPASTEVTKNLTPGGIGPGGRPMVLTDRQAGPRKPRNTDEVLPRCPRCTHDQLAVLCPVASTATAMRYHRCPTCDYSEKRMPASIAHAMRGQYTVPDPEGPEPREKVSQSAVRRPEI